MKTGFKPMLAATIEDEGKIQFPVYVSAKLDGVRAMVIGGRLLSRNLKLIPNHYVQEKFGRPEYEGFDGELIAGAPTAADAFRKTTSAVMSHDGEPDNVVFYVFDTTADSAAFELRWLRLLKAIPKNGRSGVTVCQQVRVLGLEELAIIEQGFLTAGYEGAILRSPTSPYKFGRSTMREQFLMKLKRFRDSEAEVLGMDEQQENTNEATRNELGGVKRSSAKAGKVGKNTLGAFYVRDIKTGVEFSVGSGFDDELRKEIWTHPRRYLGKIIRYKHFAIGAKDKPRFPIFQGFRDERDM